MVRIFGVIAALAVALLTSAPQALAQAGPLSITPGSSTTCVFQGPSGGPYTRAGCDYTLVNTTGAALVVKGWVSSNFEPSWLNVSINGGARVTNGFSSPFTVNLPANGSASVALNPREGSPAPGDGALGTVSFQANGSTQQVLAAARISLVANNDNFSGAKIFTGVGANTANFANAGATKEADEPNHAGNAGGASLWWRYTAPASGSVTLKLEFTNFNAILAVYTGSAVSSLTPVASGIGATASMTFPVTAGTTYYIAVDGVGGVTGQGQFNMTQNLVVANDMFANAVTLPGDGGSALQFASQTVLPTRETGEPNHGGSAGGSVWYRWTAPANAVYRFQTGSSNTITPPIVAVYLGNTLSTLTEVNSAPNLANRATFVDFTAVAGRTYQLAIAGGIEIAPYSVSLQLAPQKPLGLYSAILPASRAGAPGQILGVFANMVNTTNQTGVNCRPLAPNVFSNVTPNGYAYQTTAPDNTFIGTPNTPVNIPPGGTQNFIVQFQRGETITSGVVGLRFTCDNLADAPFYPDANGWILRYLFPEPADVIAIGVTLPGPPAGVVDVSSGPSVFVAAGVNIGTAQTIVAVPRATMPGGVDLLVCETDDSGACLATASPSVTITPFDTATVRFFTVFVNPLGSPIPFDPGGTRLFLEFRQGTATGIVVGATSVAVQRF